jgi:hypothetical protein
VVANNASRKRNTEPVSIRVVRDDEVSIHLGGEAAGKIKRTGFLRVWKGDRRKPTVRALLRSNTHKLGKLSAGEHRLR